MPRDDWFRRTTWRAADADEFFERLDSSRGDFHKAQYLRIQAHTLYATDEINLVRAALELLQRLISDFPVPSELSIAHLQAARCYEKLGDIGNAVEQLQLSLHAQEAYPNSDTGVRIEFPWFVATHSLAEYYAAALETLNRAHVAFPVSAFKAAASRAFIAEALEKPDAVKYAKEALEAAALDQSQFRYHRRLGLVGGEYAPFIKRLRAIAAT